MDGTPVSVANTDMNTDGGQLVATDGAPVQTSAVATTLSNWELPKLPSELLGSIEKITCGVEIEEGIVREASYAIAGTQRGETRTELYLETNAGHLIYINRNISKNLANATITMNNGAVRRLDFDVTFDDYGMPQPMSADTADDYFSNLQNGAVVNGLKSTNLPDMGEDDDDGSRRKLAVDYGWCSMAAGFVTGFSSDSSNYCDPSQSCDSSGGCGNSVSSCCIVHDKCLQANVAGTSRCEQTNCKGSTCDSHLSSCAWGVSCSYKYKCGWWSCWGYDVGCGAASTAIAGVMGLGSSSPQASWNTDGDDLHSCCDGSC